MVITGLHFDKIKKNVLAYCNVPYTVSNNTLEQSITIHTELKHRDTVLVVRFIDISEVNLGDCFTVSLKEVSVDPEFVIRKEKFTVSHISRADFDGIDIDTAYRRMAMFLRAPIDFDAIPPSKYVEQCKEINEQWLVNESFQLVLFLSRGDLGDDWLFKIVQDNGTEICSYLKPEETTGNVCRCLISVARECFERGVHEGTFRACERMMGDVVRGVLVNSGIHHRDQPGELLTLQSGASIRRKRDNI